MDPVDRLIKASKAGEDHPAAPGQRVCGRCFEPVAGTTDKEGERVFDRLCTPCSLRVARAKAAAAPEPMPARTDCRYCSAGSVVSPAAVWCVACRDNYHRKKILEVFAIPVRPRHEMTHEEIRVREAIIYWPVWEKEFKGLSNGLSADTKDKGSR